MHYVNISSYLNMIGKGHDFLETPINEHIEKSLYEMSRLVNKKEPFVKRHNFVSNDVLQICIAQFDENSADISGRPGLVYVLCAEICNIDGPISFINSDFSNLFIKKVYIILNKLLENLMLENIKFSDAQSFRETMIPDFRSAEKIIVNDIDVSLQVSNSDKNRYDNNIDEIKSHDTLNKNRAVSEYNEYSINDTQYKLGNQREYNSNRVATSTPVHVIIVLTLTIINILISLSIFGLTVYEIRLIDNRQSMRSGIFDR